MTVLVTGGAGFIGSHLTERLLADGKDVVVLDSLRRGDNSIRHLASREGFVLEVGDIRDDAVLLRVAERGPFDVIYHLAALHYIPECIAHPVETLSINVVGTQALVTALACRRFVLASTGDVYAQRDQGCEEVDPVEPFNVYGLSKFFCERLLENEAHSRQTTTWVVARLFNVYGPRETTPHVIPHILGEVRRGNGVRLGSLWPRRDYTYVADTVDALVALGEVPLSGPFHVFNVGTGVAASVREIVELLSELLGTHLRAEVTPERIRPVERPHLQANISKIRKVAGWQPQYSLRDGLKALCTAEGHLR